MRPATDQPIEDYAATLEGVGHRFGRLRVLNQLSFSLKRRGTTAFLGRNGAGKSTTLAMLAGLIAPASGALRCAGGEPWRDAAARGRIGYLPERPPLYPSVSVSEHLALAGGLHGLGGRGLAKAMDRVIDACDLSAVSARPTGRLSLGYRQRVALAMAVIHEPSVLLLDEPGNGLDPVQLDSLRRLVDAYAERAAVLYSTHMLDEALAGPDRILVLHEGSIVFDGSPGELEGDRPRLRLRFAGTVAPEHFAGIPGIRAHAATGDGEWLVTLHHADDRSEVLRRLAAAEPGLVSAIPSGAREHLLACMSGGEAP